MLNEQDDIVQSLNLSIPYWNGLRSSTFWREFKEEGQLIPFTVYLLIAVGGGFASIFRSESKPITSVVLALTVSALLTMIIAKVHYRLRAFQLDNQLKIIRAAQLEDRTNKEVFDKQS